MYQYCVSACSIMIGLFEGHWPINVTCIVEWNYVFYDLSLSPKVSANPGLPGPPEECRVTRETNASLTVVCSPGWSGGLHQTFHLGQIQPNIDWFAEMHLGYFAVNGFLVRTVGRRRSDSAAEREPAEEAEVWVGQLAVRPEIDHPNILRQQER